MGKKILIVTPIIIFILTIVICFAYWNFNRSFKNQLTNLQANLNGQTTIITIDMLQNLPAPVIKYLTYSGVVGKKIPKTVFLKQTGKIRQSPESSWMDFEAVEYYSIDPPSFIWKASLPSSKIPFVLGLDKYSNGQGNMTIKMLSLIPFVDARGSELDQGAMMRYLNEMMWFPAAFLGENISWKEIDNTSAEVTLHDKGKNATAVLHFDKEGKLINFVAKRYMSSGKEFKFETWSTPLTEYKEFEGLRLPTKGKAIWHPKSGDFEYIELEINDIKFE